jgi:hypothetical protein
MIRYSVRSPVPLLRLKLVNLEEVSVRVGEGGSNPPRIFLGLGLFELYPVRLQLGEGIPAIVNAQKYRGTPRGLPLTGRVVIRVFVSSRKERQFQVLFLGTDGDISVAGRRSIVCLLLEADLLGVELDRDVLILHNESELEYFRIHDLASISDSLYKPVAIYRLFTSTPAVVSKPREQASSITEH